MLQLRVRRYIRRIKDAKKGFKVALLVINLTFTAVNDSELLALIRETYHHITKLKITPVSKDKDEN